jgi:AraC family transcriptional regulator, exoenzyme S synthesis regulatory protein ExsA
MSAAVDYFDAIRTNPTFRKFAIGDLLFSNHTCPAREPVVTVWTHTDHLIHVLSGRKTWQTPCGSWVGSPGHTFFLKKGAYVVHQNFRADFCVLQFFIPDEFVRETVRGLALDLRATPARRDPSEMIIPVSTDVGLSAFFHSMAEYFTGDEQPAEALLKLKLRELITSILLGRKNETLATYFRVLAAMEHPSIRSIMEANFVHNLPLEAFARMCHRSLASFKREFQEQFGKPPGRWLLERRLEHAASLLIASNLTVTEIVSECGFEAPSHFSRSFKEKFGRSPSDYRAAQAVLV